MLTAASMRGYKLEAAYQRGKDTMARPFTDVIGDLAGGQAAEELTDKLTEVVQGVMDAGKVGDLTLKVKVKPNGERAVLTTYEIKANTPEPAKRETVFFCTSGGDLLRDNPDQSKLPLREVDGDKSADMREVS